MKYKTTQRDVKNGYYKTVSIGYCDAQHLLNYQSPIAYTCGTYGWNADIYDFDNIAIVTGYRPFGNTKFDHSILEEYEKKAEKIVNDWNMDYNDKRDIVNGYLKEFLKTVCNVNVVNV